MTTVPRPDPAAEATAFTINLDRLVLDFDTLTEVVAGILASTGEQWFLQRELRARIKNHIITVGTANLRAWRTGLDDTAQAEQVTAAHKALQYAYDRDAFPELWGDQFYKRLQLWWDTLDSGQRSRYNAGTLQRFGERGAH